MKKLFYAALALILILFGLEKLWDKLLLQNSNIKLSHVITDHSDAQLLIHGPCEPLFTISPQYLDSLTGIKSYNFALRHTDFADNYLHLYLYLQHNPAPKYLLLYSTPESFDLRFNTFHTFRFAPFLSDTVVSQTVKEMDPDYWQYSFLPFAKYAYYNSYKTFDALQGLKHLLSNKKDPYFKDGYVPHENTEYTYEDDGFIAPTNLSFAAGNKVEQLADGKTYYEIYDSAQVFKWDAQREKYFRKILSLAKANGIQTIVYESTPYWGSIVTQPNRKQFLKKTRAICEEYSIPYWLFDNLELGAKKENFVCPLIVGEKGGEIFMKALSERLKTSFLLEQKH